MKFGPDRRVRKRPEFLEIQRIGRRVKTSHFVWIIAPSTSPDGPSRLGITASKRTGNSARRSRLKRVVRAAFREMNGMLPPGYDLVVICLKDEPDMGLPIVLREWKGASKRVQKALEQLKSTSS